MKFSNFITIEESFKDAKLKWIKSESPETVEKVIGIFKSLKDRNIISGKENDIGYWLSKDFNEFMKFVKSKEYVKKEKEQASISEKDATKVFENDDVLIVIPKTHAASCKYGANTKWCISSRDENAYSYSLYYHSRGLTVYFFIFKNDNKLTKHFNSKKFGLVVKTKKEGDVLHSIWDERDEKFSSEQINYFIKEIKKMGLPTEYKNMVALKKEPIEIKIKEEDVEGIADRVNKNVVSKYMENASEKDYKMNRAILIDALSGKKILYNKITGEKLLGIIFDFLGDLERKHNKRVDNKWYNFYEEYKGHLLTQFLVWFNTKYGIERYEFKK